MNILNLRGWEVTDSQEDERDYHIHAKYTPEPTGCPNCKSLFDKLYRHGTRPQELADLPAHGKRVTIHLTRTRYRCQSCGKTFLQPLPDVDEGRQMTRRLMRWVGEQSIRRTFVSIADETGLDEKTVRNLFDLHVRWLDLTTTFVTPERLGIDEVHLLKKPRLVLTNLAERTIVGVLEKRDKATVTAHLAGLKTPEVVRVVAMDMWRPYLDAVHATLPDATVVVDKFHVVRMASFGMETVRKSQRGSLEPKYRRRLMHDRFILLRRPKDLDDGQRKVMAGWFEQFPTLAEAYRLKEAFYDLYDLPEKAAAVEAYGEWERSVKGTELTTAFRPLLTAVRNWQEQVFAYWDHRETNAVTEALNGIAKYIERAGRGYSFQAMRAKMLYSKSHLRPPAGAMPAKTPLFPGSVDHPPTLGVDIDALLETLEQEASRPDASNRRP